MTATVDFQQGTFYVSVFRDGMRIEHRHGSYPDVVRFAVAMGVARHDVALTPAAQGAAMGEVR